MEAKVLFNIGVILLMLALYFFFRNMMRSDPVFEKLYAEVITSDKYKVKGRFD